MENLTKVLHLSDCSAGVLRAGSQKADASHGAENSILTSLASLLTASSSPLHFVYKLRAEIVKELDKKDAKTNANIHKDNPLTFPQYQAAFSGKNTLPNDSCLLLDMLQASYSP